MFRSTKYDFVFTGTGCAGLSLLIRMLKSGHFREKKFLVIDREEKNRNDRTWCFWEKQSGYFEEIVLKKWQRLEFLGEDIHSNWSIAPYEYKMIRAIDFYSYCLQELSAHENVERVYGEVNSCTQDQEGIQLVLNGESFQLGAGIVFNSIYHPRQEQQGLQKLLQHFMGWMIETEADLFIVDQARLMDFSISQEKGTAFMYVLPLGPGKALVEYTFFTKQVLKKEEYEEGLRSYIRDHLAITEYKISETEFGVIPMTNEKFNFFEKGVFNIGTAGGQTKASTGYTFQFIQKQSGLILRTLEKGKDLRKLKFTPPRFRFYDNTLLDILYNDKLPGRKIFSRMFRKNKTQQVLKFLDNETSFPEELKIISTLPTGVFLKAGLKVMFR